MNNDIWIRITFNACGNFNGKEEFVDELRQFCVVQKREIWYPAACSGHEFIAEVFFNSDFGDFVHNIVLSGFAWDILKLSCSKIWKAFRKFTEMNEGFELQTLRLTFNDVTIKVNETLDDHYVFLAKLFLCLPKHWSNFYKLGIKNIVKIELPLYPNDCNFDILDRFEPDEVKDPEKCIWYICYELEMETCYYSPEIMRVVCP